MRFLVSGQRTLATAAINASTMKSGTMFESQLEGASTRSGTVKAANPRSGLSIWSVTQNDFGATLPGGARKLERLGIVAADIEDDEHIACGHVQQILRPQARRGRNQEKPRPHHVQMREEILRALFW